MADVDLRDQAVAALADELNELKLTTRGLKGFTPPAGSHWGKALAARKRSLDLLAQIGGSPPPPPTSTSHLGLIDLDGNLNQYSRIGDYETVVVSNSEPLLSSHPSAHMLPYMNAMKIRMDGGSGITYSEAQARGYLTGVPTPGYPAVFADVRNTTYQSWFATQAVALAHSLGTPGIYIDDMAVTPRVTLSGYTQPQFQAAMASLCATVGQALKTAGLYLLVNANGYLSGDGRSDTGELDAAWFRQIGPSVNGLMSESFMTTRDGSNTPRTLGSGWTQNADGWAKLPSVAESVGCDFIGLTYGPLSTAIYAYAVVLTQAKRPGSCLMWKDGDSDSLLGRYTGTASVDLAAGTGVVA